MLKKDVELTSASKSENAPFMRLVSRLNNYKYGMEDRLRVPLLHSKCSVLIANYLTIAFHYSLQLAFPWWSPCNPTL